MFDVLGCGNNDFRRRNVVSEQSFISAQRLIVDSEANVLKDFITVIGTRESRARSSQQDDVSRRFKLEIVLVREHTEVIIGIFAHTRETNNLAFSSLLEAIAIDSTEAIVCSTKTDQSTNPFSELLNVHKSLKSPFFGAPTRSLTLSSDENKVPSQVTDVLGNKCIDHSHGVRGFRDRKVARNIDSRLHVELGPIGTTTSHVVFIIFQACPPGSTDPSTMLKASDTCFHDLQMVIREREREREFS